MSDLGTCVGRINDILCSVNLLQWDSRTKMPTGGAAVRGQQIATLKGLAREIILAPETRAAAEAALDGPDADAARVVLEAAAYHTALPAALLQAQAEQSAEAGQAWQEARRTADFAMFRPYLERSVDLARQQAEALGYAAHPYDPLVDLYEPGETAASLSTLFDSLRAGIRPILDAARDKTPPRRDFLFRHYPKADQQQLCHRLAALMGYDFDRGRLDTTVHPFEISMTRGDVRITSRWREDYLPMAIFGSLHETGHAMYEQGVAPGLTRTAFATDLRLLYAVGGSSFGMHESQSRLVENHIGRALPFWQAHFGLLRDAFPEQLSGVSAEDWHAAINHSAPGLTRVEADELTYDLHIMLRVRIEMALLDGSLSVTDLPEAWNAAMQEDFGLTVPDDGAGCLQDVHWSMGYFGSFPTYTVGNVTAAALFAEARQDAGRQAALERGDLMPVLAFLGDKVWRHGRRKTRTEICGPMDTAPYLAHLKARFAG